jgi:hypothetical protein
LRPELVPALERDGIKAVFVDTSAPEGYWETLAAWWKAQQSFIVLEHDKIPAPGLLAEIWNCDQPWCTTPVSMRGVEETSPYPSLSCTKFASELMSEHPGLLEEIGRTDFGFGFKEWSRLDLGMAGYLGSHYDVHWHSGGRVEHLHDR